MLQRAAGRKAEEEAGNGSLPPEISFGKSSSFACGLTALKTCRRGGNGTLAGFGASISWTGTASVTVWGSDFGPKNRV